MTTSASKTIATILYRLTVPTAEMRTGNLNVACRGKPTTIYDPYSGNVTNGTGRVAFSPTT